MKQARWTSSGIELAEVDPGPLPQGWARLQVLACGICGTDLHLLRTAAARVAGAAPGHEIAGVPLEGARELADALYAVEPRTWCGGCEFCLCGDRHLCPSGTLLGISAPGGLAEFVAAPLASLHRVPGALEPLAASLAEPLAVCVRAVHLARLRADSRVLVLGGGSIGLICALLVRERAARVGISVRHAQQRAAGKALGLEVVSEEAVGEWAAEVAPDVVIETVGGAADTADQAIRLCRPSGRVIVVGVFGGRRPVDLLALMAKEITLIGSNTYGTGPRGSEFAAAVALLPSLARELAGLQTHQFPLHQIGEAFAAAAEKRSGAIKVTLIP